jgi:hypothetical protein
VTEHRQSHWRTRAAFAVAIVGLVALGSVRLGGESYAWSTQATGHYQAGIGTWSTPTPATPSAAESPGATASESPSAPASASESPGASTSEELGNG